MSKRIRNPRQDHLLVWRLLVTGEEPKITGLKPRTTAKDLARLLEARIVEIEKRPTATSKTGKPIRPATFLRLGDRAWDTAGELATEMPAHASAGPVLAALLGRLTSYARRHGVPLVEILRPAPEPEQGLEERLRAALLSASGGQLNQRVRLTRLRELLRSDGRETVDAALLQMQVRGDLVLYRLDNPAERYPEDDLAAVDVAGEKRHIAYLTR